MKKYLLPIALILGGATAFAADMVPAFPGAEGHGRYTTGGRGGKVIHVTNLNDSGTGSLRAAVSGSSKKTVVFDVSGYIDLKSDLKIGANTTIAGQTAPGQGITLRYYTVRPNGDNIIIRFLRMRRSQIKDVNDGADAAFTRNYSNIILDHCSLSWSIDEVASFYDNRDFTLQWCTVAEGLANPGHSKGAHSYGGIWGGKNASFHHNFIAHVQNRAPRFNGARYGWDGYDKEKYSSTVDAERVDFRNCVIYNWGNGDGCYGGPGGGYINIVNNYYKAGPGTKNKTRVTAVSVASSGNASSEHPELYGLASRYFIDGNYVTAASNPENFDWDGVRYDSGLLTQGGERYIKDPSHHFGNNVEYVTISGTDCVKLKLDAETEPGDVTTHTSPVAYDKVLEYAGASLWRDATDARYMEEARTGTATYTGEIAKVAGISDFINDPEGEQIATRPSYPDLLAETRPANWDTDKDGIPDEWETAHGLNPSLASDGNATTLDPKGYYTNLEIYLHSIVENIMKGGNDGATASFDEYWPEAGQSGIGEIEASKGDVLSIEYYNLNGIRLAEPAQGISIRRTVYSDGSIVTDKVYK